MNALSRLVLGSALAAVGIVAAGCKGPPVLSAPPSTPEPAPIAPLDPVTPPTAVSAVATCPLRLRVEVRPASDGQHDVTVFAEADSTEDIELPDRCPQGLVDFEGLGPGYDYYGVCNAGACPGARPAQHVRVGAGERVPLASTRIATRGTTCTKPLAAGRYTIRPIVPESVHACVVPALLEVGAPAPTQPPAPPAPPPRPSPPPTIVPVPPPAPLPGAIATDIYSCTQASDCVLSCPKVAGCCSSSCGCRHAINKAHRANYEASYKSTCQKPPKCPAEACAFQPAIGVECRAGRCVATNHL